MPDICTQDMSNCCLERN